MQKPTELNLKMLLLAFVTASVMACGGGGGGVDGGGGDSTSPAVEEPAPEAPAEEPAPEIPAEPTELWTWMSGSTELDAPASYGEKGITAATNVPGSRSFSISWTDSDNNLWLFGGSYWISSTRYDLNDLWKFDGTHWTWVKGADIPGQAAVYAEQGVATAENTPGTLYNTVHWQDSAGNLWLFGGTTSNSSYFNTLWKFDGTNWTWIGGSQSENNIGDFGSMGVTAATNMPSARRDSLSWIDSQDNLWLMGGYGYGAGGTLGRLNDLWKFDGTHWIWIRGASDVNQKTMYDEQEPSINTPGVRQLSASWIDAADNLWLFGGDGRAVGGANGDLNDLWKFDGSNWIWVSGDLSINNSDVHGTKGVADAANKPGARTDALGWSDNAGNVWIYAGITGRLPYNDLWTFDGTHWTWMAGEDFTEADGVYGERGVPAAGNSPGAREYHTTWFDGAGNLWLFGGLGWDGNSNYDVLNDLWKFDGKHWVWVSGYTAFDYSPDGPPASDFGTQGVAAETNIPRHAEDRINWVDNNGNFWLFGGTGYVVNTSGFLSDLWRYQP